MGAGRGGGDGSRSRPLPHALLVGRKWKKRKKKKRGKREEEERKKKKKKSEAAENGGKFKRLLRLLQVIVGGPAGAVPAAGAAVPGAGGHPPQPGGVRGGISLRLQAREGRGVLPGEVAGVPRGRQHLGAPQEPAVPGAAEAAAPGPGPCPGGAGTSRPPGTARPRRLLPGAESRAAPGPAVLGAAPQQHPQPPGPHRGGKRGGFARAPPGLRLHQRVQSGGRHHPDAGGGGLRVPRLLGGGGGGLLPGRFPQQIRLQRVGAGADPGWAAHLRVQLPLPLRRRLPQPRGAEGDPLRPLHLPHGQRPRMGRPHPPAHSQEQLRHGVRGRGERAWFGCGGGVAGLGSASLYTLPPPQIITSEEAERRGQVYDRQGATYLFDLDYVEDVYTVDAAHYGNISHFVNHSCDPNLQVYNVFIENLDERLPRIALFATRPIRAGEELTFDYNMHVDPVDAESTRMDSNFGLAAGGLGGSPRARGRIECKCGAAACRKYLF
ncbi:histone-lysine N-methyltransferase SUV39H1 isoform X1 [Chroicocephalus ridibundus]|uniref:histone-lysine N-methyltransferase SUV39H1 isoform X1 n=1 Tax=Chroicocephalus ridibundus TaxID=1192867 RepID=UPI002FDD66A5